MHAKRVFCIFVLFLFIGLAPGYAGAQTSIAVVDVQKLLTESNAAQSIQKQAQVKRDTFLSGISKQEQELRKNEKELIELKAKLSQEEFSKKRQDFEKKFLETRGLAQRQKKDIDEAIIIAMRKIRNELYAKVQAVADEKNYDLVISKQNVVIGAVSLDITEEVMARLNKSFSEVKLEFSSK